MVTWTKVLSPENWPEFPSITEGIKPSLFGETETQMMSERLNVDGRQSIRAFRQCWRKNNPIWFKTTSTGIKYNTCLYSRMWERIFSDELDFKPNKKLSVGQICLLSTFWKTCWSSISKVCVTPLCQVVASHRNTLCWWRQQYIACASNKKMDVAYAAI